MTTYTDIIFPGISIPLACGYKATITEVNLSKTERFVGVVETFEGLRFSNTWTFNGISQDEEYNFDCRILDFLQYDEDESEDYNFMNEDFGSGCYYGCED